MEIKNSINTKRLLRQTLLGVNTGCLRNTNGKYHVDGNIHLGEANATLALTLGAQQAY
jgi:hypothetical protein